MYFIIEIKSDKTGENAAICPIPGYTDKDKAISAYYYKLVYASDPDLSQTELHTVELIDHLGQTLMCNVFQHEYPAPEPEPEPEPEEDDPIEPVEEELEEEVPEPDIDEPAEEPAIDEPVEDEPEPEEDEPEPAEDVAEEGEEP